MKLGDFISKTISEVKENVKGPVGIKDAEVELDLIASPDDGAINVINWIKDSPNVSRIKLTLLIR